MPEPRPDPGLRRTQRAGRDRTDDDVLVAPGYLAGSAYCGTDAFVPLTHHYWHDMSDEMGNFYVTTMGSQLRIAYVPEASELMPDATALWQIRCRTDLHAPPTWTAAFTDETPPEIVAAVTAALDADVTAGRWNDEPYRERDDHPEMVWEVLRAARWQITVDGWHITATSPDRLARLEYRPPSSFGGHKVARDEAWRARILAAPDARRALWEADFHSATPAHLVAAFATALADPAPVSRERACVPRECHAHLRPLKPDASAAPRAVAAPTPRDLARARAARSPALPTASVPRWSTTTRPPAVAAPAVTPGPRR
ncbi:DUF317 domain-containing protein [Streptomyces scabiei]|uniref:DUF317 domain-containing protein n=1 Tax=Streptomyces scabiei TaxID=1930 RepID=UPI002FEE9879